MHLRVLTLNVWNSEGDARRTSAINEELHRLRPDLIAFQEVISSSTNNQLEHLTEGLGFYRTHQSQVQSYIPPFADRYGGSAVATRWPHRVAEVLDLRLSGASDLPWATIAVLLDFPEGELLFIATTASWRLDAEAAREQQALALADLDARHRRDLPTIIAGDLNTAPDAASVRFLAGQQSLAGRAVHYHDAWAVAGTGPGYTWTVDNPNARVGIDQIVRQPNHRRRIDYIFIGSWEAHPKAHARVSSAKLAFNEPLDGLWASDHFGVIVDLDIDRDS